MLAPSLHVFDQGSGPPVVLLHGLPSPPGDLERVADCLRGYRVLVPHLPGYAGSPAAPGRQGIAAVEETLLARLRELQVERPTLVGYSVGAYRVLSLASRLEARSVLALAGFGALSAEERTGMAGFAAMLRSGTSLKSVLPPRFRACEHRAARPELDATVEAWLDAAPAAVLAEELDDLARAPSVLEALGRVSCPVIARTGSLDVAVPPCHADEVARAARQGILEIVPGVAHALFLEDEVGTLDAIRRASSIP